VKYRKILVTADESECHADTFCELLIQESSAVMRKITILVGIVFLMVMVVMGWQIVSCELANVQLQDDMQDIASQAGTRIGFVEPRSDEDLRKAVLRKAKEHDIELEPAQVRVQRTASADMPTVYLAADYVVLVKLPVGAFALHFTPSAGKKTF
jgi:hypothetical protein